MHGPTLRRSCRNVPGLVHSPGMAEQRKIHTVTEVNRRVRALLESGIGELWVEGERSRVTLQASGHW